MKKLIFYGRLFISLFLFGCSENVQNSNDHDNISLGERIKERENTNISESNTGKQEENYHEKFSIQALADKNFTGKDLELVNQIVEKPQYTRYYIEYKSQNLKISGIMNIPHGEGPFPVLILNHGYIHPPAYTVGRGLKREQDYFARNGYAVLHTDYRNHGRSSDVEGDEFDIGYTIDAINAVKAVENSDLKSLDKERIGMLGHSMGGGVVLRSITAKPDLVDAAALYAPESGHAYKNFKRWGIDGDKKDVSDHPATKKYGTKEENPEFRENLSPVNFVEKIKIPVILQHGTADESVPVQWSDNLHEKMKKAGKDIQYYKYEGGKHEFVTNRDKFMERNLKFFDKNLR